MGDRRQALPGASGSPQAAVRVSEAAGRRPRPDQLIGGLAKQVAAVRAVVEESISGAPVTGVLCFVDADVPLLGTLRFDGHLLLSAGRLAKRLNAPGPVTSADATAVAAVLAQRFPAA